MNIHKHHSPELKPKDRMVERLGYPTLVSFCCGILALIFGVFSSICMGFSRGGFPDGWGILGILSLIACWSIGGIGTLVGFYGTLSDEYGRHACKAVIFCIIVVVIATGSEMVIDFTKPSTGGPGAAGGF